MWDFLKLSCQIAVGLALGGVAQEVIHARGRALSR